MQSSSKIGVLTLLGIFIICHKSRLWRTTCIALRFIIIVWRRPISSSFDLVTKCGCGKSTTSSPSANHVHSTKSRGPILKGPTSLLETFFKFTSSVSFGRARKVGIVDCIWFSVRVVARIRRSPPSLMKYIRFIFLLIPPFSFPHASFSSFSSSSLDPRKVRMDTVRNSFQPDRTVAFSSSLEPSVDELPL